MRRIDGLSAVTLTVALLFGACLPAEAGDTSAAGPGASPLRGSDVPARAEPDPGEILVPPPPGAEYQAEASALASEDLSGGPSTYGTGGHFEAEDAVAYVYVTDLSLEEVARYYMDLREETPHYMDLQDLVDWDAGPEVLNIEEEPAAMLPPDELEAAIRQYREQGHLTEAEARETMDGMDLYRRMYPKIKDLMLSTLTFNIEESPKDGDVESRQEYRYVDVEVTRPYVDVVNEEVRDRTVVIYEVYHMKRQGR